MSYKLRDWDNNLTNCPSNETLGVNGSAEAQVMLSNKQRRYLIILVIIVILLLAVCIVLSVFLAKEYTAQKSGSSVTGKGKRLTQNTQCFISECLQISSTFRRNMDESVDPCKDFYRHSCGSWIRNNPVPPSRNRFDTFMEVEDVNARNLRELLELEEELAVDSALAKTKFYYKSCLNEEETERTSMRSIRDLINLYGSWALENGSWNASRWNWPKIMLPMLRDLPLLSPLLMIVLNINPRNSSRHILAVS